MEANQEIVGLDSEVGDSHYRSWIDWPESYDFASTLMFNLLTSLGLRQHHYLLDIGCGSLRGGRLFIPYLLPERYHGVEPKEWVLEEGIKHEVGRDLINIKSPRFSHDDSFDLTVFNQKFDFVLCSLVLGHLPTSRLEKCFAEVKGVLKPEGVFVSNFEEGDKNHDGPVGKYPEHVLYTLDYIEGVAAENDMVTRVIDCHSPNASTKWVIFTHKENEKNLPSFDPRLLYKQELEILKGRLRRFETHPYVMFGLEVLSLLRSVKKLFKGSGERPR